VIDREAMSARFDGRERSRLVRNGEITPRWLPDRDQCWYRRTEADGSHLFVLVDAETGADRPSFDHAALATALSQRAGQPVSAAQLPFLHIDWSPDARAICFDAFGKRWRHHVGSENCEELPPIDHESVTSPDGEWSAFVRDHNLVVRRTDGLERALTHDGIPHFGYASPAQDTGLHLTMSRYSRPVRPRVLWSPCSRYLVTHRVDERSIPPFPMIETDPLDEPSRPRLYEYRFSQPGERHVPTSELIVFDLEAESRRTLALPPGDPRFKDVFALASIWFGRDSRKIHVLQHDRYFQTYELYRVDIDTGTSTRLVHEISPTHYNMNWLFYRPLVRILSSGEIIWHSERSGWGHLYLHDAQGKFVRALTAGDWLVREILHVDEESRLIFILGSGREPGRHPYDRYLYKVSLDGAEPELLTPEDADHCQFDPEFLQGPEGTGPFSPSGRYFVDSFSRPDLPPHVVVRDVEGKILHSEQSDIAMLLAESFVMPEPFSVTAADGETTLYGTLFKPSDFDVSQAYPIVEFIYPGPQSVLDSRKFVDLFSGPATDRQAMAEAGFIVIVLDGRGTPYRSKQFWNESYANMATAGTLDDHVAGLKELAAARPYLDINRVGITGWSGGGYASARALLAYPDFYKVGFAIAGDHDQPRYLSLWADMYNGPDQAPLLETDNARLAATLTGKLFLVHGEMDDNVPMSQTMRLANALIRAGKDFDMLIVPSANHALAAPWEGDRPQQIVQWLQAKRRRYFINHL
jgi:dipeptidyl aminopeptidase/acylaminoacyl peptidase